jgi:HEAT repeat protein
MLLLLLALWVIFFGAAPPQPPPKASPQLEFLMNELRAESPFYFRWLNRNIGPNLARSRIVEPLVRRVVRNDFENWQRRRTAAAQLIALGTNAWPVVPALVDDLNADLQLGLPAASVLVGIQADQHPSWNELLPRLRMKSAPVRVFRHLLTGWDEFTRTYDLRHRRFALLGLAAVGTTAAPAIPDLIELLNSENDHELWPAAATTLQAIGAPPERFVPRLCAYLLDATRYPTKRASAALALAQPTPPTPDALDALHHALRDDLGVIRVAAARALWQLNVPLADLISTIADLLNHRLRTVRVAALELIADIGPPAFPCRSQVESLLQAENEPVRDAAAAALASIGSSTTESKP